MKENKELWELFVLQSHNFENKAVSMKSNKLNFSLKMSMNFQFTLLVKYLTKLKIIFADN